MSKKPHCSEALSSLRLWVTVAATVAITCLAIQMLIFGVVRYTDVRWTSTYTPPKHQAPVVVPAGVEAPASPKGGTLQNDDKRDQGSWALGREELLRQQAGREKPAEVNRVLSRWDVMLGNFQDLSATAGVVAIFTLLGITLLGVIVGSGNQAPGIEKATAAAGWAFIVFAMGLPLQQAMPALPFPGVFRSYAALVGDGSAGTVPREAMVFLGVPAAMCCALFLIILRFRAGVERGIIVQSVSELDEELERELSTIGRKGIASNSPRSVGALNQALGATGTDDSGPKLSLRPRATQDPDDDSKRPI